MNCRFLQNHRPTLTMMIQARTPDRVLELIEKGIKGSTDAFGLQIEVLELAQVKADPPMQFGNGDRCQFLDHTFLCRWVSGEAKVNDEESSQVRWVDVSDPAERALLSERMLDRIDAALNYDGHCRFGLESVPPEDL